MSGQDGFRPSNATGWGQMLRFTESLGRSRYGRPIAIVMLVGALLLGLVIVWGVVSAVTSTAP